MPSLVRFCGACQTEYARNVDRCPKDRVTPAFKHKCDVCGNLYNFADHASECEVRHRDSQRTGIDWSAVPDNTCHERS